MLSLNTEDIKTSLKDLSGIFRIMAMIFLLPLPVAIYFILLKDLFGGTLQLPDAFNAAASTSVMEILGMLAAIVSRSLVYLAPAAASYFLYYALREIPAESSTKTKHVVASVAIGWLLISVISSMPYVLTGTLTNWIDAWFESMSGWSTTGLSLIKDVDSAPRDILFYRSLTQWFGGLGVVFIALTIFMRKGTAAMDYYISDRKERRIKPSVKGTVTEIWKIYGVYTILCIVALSFAGMGFFDSINHAMTTVATGGFSTHNDRISHYADKPFVAPVIMFFMLVGSISFMVHFRLFEGDLKGLLENIEFRYMTTLIILSTAALSFLLYVTDTPSGTSPLIESAFQSISAITTTGFFPTDLSQWPSAAQAILILLMYIGGFYGSTAGGIKILRLIVIGQVINYSIKKLMLPKTAMLSIKIADKPIKDEEIYSVVAIAASFLAVLAIGSVLLMLDSHLNPLQCLFLSTSATANAGLANVAPQEWFAITDVSKITLTLLMWAGRIEVIPVLILLSTTLSPPKKKANYGAKKEGSKM